MHKTLHSWLPHRWWNRRELEALIGHFQHVAKVVWPRRTFLRRMTDLLCCSRNKKHPIHLNREFRLDLQWWQLFLSSCNGVGFWLFPGMNAISDLEVTSDAADILGYGAYARGKWFYGSWAPTQAHQSIAYKELFLVVVAAHLWGCRWSKKHVLFRSDNEAVVAIPSARTLECSVLVHLLRDLLLSAARWGFTFSAAHLPGVDNKGADAVSRFRLQGFRRLAPEAQAAPCTVPQFNSFLLAGSVPILSCARVNAVYVQVLRVWSAVINRILSSGRETTP